MYRSILRQLHPYSIGKGHRLDHLAVSSRCKRSLLERRRINADAKRLGEDQGIARFGIGVATNVPLGANTDHSKTIDGFRAIDGMSARYRDPCRTTYLRPACKNLAYGLCRNLINRHAQNCERHDRLAAHGVNVRNGIGCGDATEV